MDSKNSDNSTTKRSEDKKPIELQKKAITRLMKDRSIITGNIPKALNLITQTASEILGAHRASVWLIDSNKHRMNCIDLFLIESHSHQKGLILPEQTFSRYIINLVQEIRISVDDVLSDPDCSEMIESYLAPLGIKSLLDSCFSTGINHMGVLRLEYFQNHPWTYHEEAFASSLAFLCGQVILLGKQKETENNLKTTRKMLDRTINFMPTGIGITDYQGNILRINEKMVEMFGYTNRDVPNLDSWNIKAYPDEEYRETVTQQWNKDINDARQNQRDSVLREIRITCKDGNYKNILISSKPMEDRILTTFIDITAQKKIDQKLRDSQRKLSEAQHFASMGHYTMDLITGIWTNSEEMDRILGMDENYKRDVQGWANLVHPEDRQQMADYFTYDVLKKQESFNREYRIIDQRTGQVKWVHGLGKLIFNEEGQPVEMFGTMQDITSRIEIFQRFNKSRQRYQSLFQNAPVALWEEDYTALLAYLNKLQQEEKIEDMLLFLKEHPSVVKQCLEMIKVVDVNEEAIRMHQVDNKDQLLSDLSQVLTEKDQLNFIHELVALTQRKKNFETEAQVLTFKGQEKHVYVKAHFDYSKNSCTTLIASLDITQRKLAEEKLMRMQRLDSLATMAGGIAHDFNNLLTGIFGYIELAQGELSKEHKSLEYLENAIEAMDGASALANRLLIFSRGSEPSLTLISMDELIQDTVIFHLSGSNVTPQFEISKDLWPIKADRGQMRQVISNLTINAQQAMKRGGLLQVKVKNKYNQ
ncbi:MAG: PAS domain S-box protein [Spirochaetaceae bacterium]|jgi:PAS domain S-box-containing protein|nr:PAS domain S-box protein [Spirochaetaceae bacterium]